MAPLAPALLASANANKREFLRPVTPEAVANSGQTIALLPSG